MSEVGNQGRRVETMTDSLRIILKEKKPIFFFNLKDTIHPLNFQKKTAT